MDGATYDFIVDTVTPDSNDPSILVATGTSIITTKTGQLFTDDVSVMHLSGPEPSDPVSFVTTAIVTSGTQRWKHTVGEFVASGTLVFATGNAVGNYTTTLCRGSRDHHGGKHCKR